MAIRSVNIFLAAAATVALTACIRISTPDQPKDWPHRSGMSKDCREVIGIYVDPNMITWDHEEYAANGSISKRGAHPQQAWAILQIPGSNLKLQETRVRARSFGLSFVGDQVVIDYWLDHVVVETVRVAKANWSCTEQGLVLHLGEKTGQVVDKLPAQGSSNYWIILDRRGDDLYAKASSRVGAMVLYTLPLIDVDDKWYRFAPTIEPPR
jgi:hypothetical protein